MSFYTYDGVLCLPAALLWGMHLLLPLIIGVGKAPADSSGTCDSPGKHIRYKVKKLTGCRTFKVMLYWLCGFCCCVDNDTKCLTEFQPLKGFNPGLMKCFVHIK